MKRSEGSGERARGAVFVVLKKANDVLLLLGGVLSPLALL